MTGREGIPPASSGAEGEDLSEQGGIPSRSYSPPTLCGDFASSHDAPHKAEVIRDMYYRYDPNGNVTEERQGGHSDDSVSKTFMYSTYCRLYSWDEENRLTGTSDRNYTTSYSYYHEGERTVKYSHLGETLYFDSMWLEADTDGTGKLRQTKNIYIGETRIASKLNYEDGDIEYEKTHTFYYHTDHLSSSNVITDYEGDVYEHMEYTPKDACASSKLACDQHYGEKWILDQNDSSKYDMIPYRFTAKEWDEETKLYYMSARYQNPMTSRWMSADPAGPALANPMERDDQGKMQMRSGFNIIESLNPYSYCGNNPIKYSDPTGLRLDDDLDIDLQRQQPEVSSEGYIAPTDSKRVVSGVGVRTDATPAEHTGIDVGALIKGEKGDPLYAIADGEVVRNGYTKSGSSRLEIKLPNGDSAVYQHGDFSGLKKGDKVKQGDTVGTMSDIGSEGQVHLHFEIRKNGVYTNKAANAVDPIPLLPGGYKIE